jgi:MarR-like DNA-binding transcriptional regulator SgrR of sgrS sRNA
MGLLAILSTQSPSCLQAKFTSPTFSFPLGLTSTPAFVLGGESPKQQRRIVGPCPFSPKALSRHCTIFRLIL